MEFVVKSKDGRSVVCKIEVAQGFFIGMFEYSRCSSVYVYGSDMFLLLYEILNYRGYAESTSQKIVFIVDN